MSKMSELAYDIEQLYIEGYTAKNISRILDCPVSIVEDWLKENGIISAEDLSPYATVNS